MTTVATGKLPHQSYGSLPGFHKPQVVPMERAFVMCVGPPGEGKTTFIQSCPTGYVINLDNSTTSPNIRGMVWPGINAQGQPYDQDGVVVMTWEKLLQITNTLIALAKDGKPHPTPVFFDSMDAVLPLMQDYLLRQKDEEYWQDLDGRRMYGIAYDRIVRLFHDLLNVGIGVWLIGHVVNAKIQIGEDKYVIRPELTIGDGLWRRISWALEMVCGIEQIERSTTSEVTLPDTQKADGTVRKGRTKRLTETKIQYCFVTDSSRYAELMKARISIPGEIVIPHKDAWPIVSDAYIKAANNPNLQESN